MAGLGTLSLLRAQTQIGADINGEAAVNLAGYSVSMPNRNTIAVGAPLNDGVNGTASGHVRIYKRSGNNWIQQGNDIDGEASNDQSGLPISMPDTATIAIGSFLNNGNGTDAGHVRVYSWNGSNWT